MVEATADPTKEEAKLMDAIERRLREGNYWYSECPFPLIRKDFPKERAADILNALVLLQTQGRVKTLASPSFPAVSCWMLPWESRPT